MSWMPSTNQLAQTSHFFIATTVVLAIGHPAYGMAAVLGWALVKEFAFDILVEEDSWLDSGEDFLWYMVGGLAGVGFLTLGTVFGA